MHFHSVLVAAILQLLSGICLAQSDHLNITTIAVVNNVSVFQCWQLNQTITALPPAGIVNSTTLGPLGDPVNATWLSAPAGTLLGQHHAAAVEYNVILSGTLLLNVNSTGQSAMIEGGAHGLILVTDTDPNIMGVGHSAATSPHAPSVVLMLPIKDNVVPAHTVLHDGQCLECEMNF